MAQEPAADPARKDDPSLGARVLRGSDGDRPGGALWLAFGLVSLLLIVGLALALLVSGGGAH